MNLHGILTVHVIEMYNLNTFYVTDIGSFDFGKPRLLILWSRSLCLNIGMLAHSQWHGRKYHSSQDLELGVTPKAVNKCQNYKK